MQSQDKGFKIGILGGKGLLGSDLVRFLNANFKTDSITRENYKKKKGTYYWVFINANGNTKRFWANQNPFDDFLASTVSVYQSIFDFPSNLYIYISSADVYENHTNPKYTSETKKINPANLQPYGFNKYLAELIVKKYKQNFLILRHSMILGKNLKKGPIFDILHNKPLFINLKSKLQLITTHAIAEIIEILIRNFRASDTINIGGKGSFSFTKIQKYFNRKIKILPKTETQIYELNIHKLENKYSNLKTSDEYLKKFIKDNNL